MLDNYDTEKRIREKTLTLKAQKANHHFNIDSTIIDYFKAAGSGYGYSLPNADQHLPYGLRRAQKEA